MGIIKLLPTLESASRNVTFKGAHLYKVDANHRASNNTSPAEARAPRHPLSMQDMIQTISKKRRRQSQTQVTRDSTAEDEKEELRHLRVGVDVSVWISAACHGNGAELLDERHLSNFGRYQLEKKHLDSNQPDAHMQEMAQNFIKAATSSVMRKVKSIQYLLTPGILIVLDGASPPIKKDVVEVRKKNRLEAAKKRDTLSIQNELIDIDELEQDANKRRISSAKKAGASTSLMYSTIVTSLLNIFREEQIAFMIAPYEADSQLTYLCNKGYIDYIVSEDSDFIPYGADAVLFKYKPHMPFEIGFKEGYNEASFKNCTASATLILKKELGACSSTSFSLLGFTEVVIAMVCVASGCDYVKSLKGIGLVHARNAAAEANIISSEASCVQGTFIERMLEGLFARCYGTLTKEQKDLYTISFIRAIVMFRHPVIFDPIRGKCIFTNIESPDLELTDFKPYSDIVSNDMELQYIVGELFEREMAIYVSEGWINPKNWELRNEESDTPSHVVIFSHKWTSAKAQKQFQLDCDRINDASESSQPKGQGFFGTAFAYITSPLRGSRFSQNPSQSTAGTNSVSKPSTQGSNISADILSPVML
eukprot:scaffold1972_cov265-Chaetoceros_neogracile.AAC.21